MRKSKADRRGFTLIEVLIVVVILGILASTVLPNITASSGKAKEAALRKDLAELRKLVQLYRFEHDGSFPSGTADNVVKQLTLASNASGTTAAPGTAGFPYGPYLVGQMPQNPLNGGSGIMVKTGAIGAADVDPSAMQGSVKVGWIYSSLTGQVIANSAGSTDEGILYSAL
jgi:prepilin-type N-terminal cleavage/methylation domain-containing protein